MMINLLADVAATAGKTMDANDIGIILTACGGVIGTTLGAIIGRRRGKEEAVKETETKITNQPIETRRSPQYVTREELQKVEADLKEVIKEIKESARKSTDDVHQRLNGITVKLNNVDGKMDVLLELVKENH